MVRIRMVSKALCVDRRTVLAALGGLAAAGPRGAAEAAEPPRPKLALTLAPALMRLKDEGPATPVWAFGPVGPPPRFSRGDELLVSLVNRLPAGAALSWAGIGGSAYARAALPSPVAPGDSTTLRLRLGSAGTFFFDARLPLDPAQDAAGPLPIGAFTVAETRPPQVDRDEVLLIEEWRLRDDGQPAAPGAAVDAPKPIYTVNGKPSADITVRTNERIRFRFINGCQRAAIALKIEGHDATIVAIDSAPAEPFPARDGRLILAPGTRIDAFFDATRPPGSIAPILLHDGTTPRPIGRLLYASDAPLRDAALPSPPPLEADDLPRRLDLRAAARSEVALGADGAAGWRAVADLGRTPAFKVRRGRTVVLTLTNRDSAPSVFRIHGHHVRLLDRLDDGWKPFWLDTLLLDAGQSQRIAFVANHGGAWLMEAMRPDWSSPRRLRWFVVE